MDRGEILRTAFPLALVLSGALAAPAAAAGRDWYDSFEDYDADFQIAGEGIWQTWSGGTETAEDAYVTDEEAATGDQSLKIVGPNDTVAYFPDITGEPIEGGKWIVKAKVFVPATMIGTLYFILLNTYSTACVSPCDWSVQVPMNASAGTIHDDMGGGTLPLIVDEWVEIRVEIDLDANLHSIYYGGLPLAVDRVWDDTGNRRIDAMDLYSGDCTGAYYDDVSLEKLCVPVDVAREIDTESTVKIEGLDAAAYVEGGTASVRLILENIREADPDCPELGDVTITENLPSGWTATDISGGGTFQGGKIAWTIPSANLQEGELTYEASGPAGSSTMYITIVGTVEEKGNKNFTYVRGSPLFNAASAGIAPDGAILQWLILGPLMQGVVTTSSPGTSDQLEQDFLTDGIDISETTVIPLEDDQIAVDFGGASAALRLGGSADGATRADLNPGGVPTWFAWRDLDGQVSFDNANMWGGDVNNAMAYAACYLYVPEDLEDVYFACGSDDAIQLILDGEGIWTNPILRGWPGYVDIVGPLYLAKGTHLLMVKVFEAGGGWNFGVRIQDELGSPILPPAIEARLEPPRKATVSRTLSAATYKPGDAVTVTLRLSEVASPAPAALQIVETIPDGWTPTNVSDGGTIQGRTITWNLTGAAIANDKVLTYAFGSAPQGISATFRGVYQVEGMRFGVHPKAGSRIERSPIPRDDLSPWLVADIGTPLAGGQERLSGDSFNIWGGGADITSRSDSFRFVYQSTQGDLAMWVRVDGQEGTNAKAGLMVRQSLDPGSIFYFVQATPKDGAGPRWRSTPNGSATPVLPISGKVDPPVWLKLVRVGNTFTAFTSADGSTWEQNFRTTTHKNPRTLSSLTDPVLVGFAVTAGDETKIAGAMFRDIRCEGPGCPSTAEPEAARFIRGDTDGTGNYTIGDGIQILERQFAGRWAYGSNCDETGDIDGNGVLTIGDAIWLFNYLFAGGPPPMPPAPACGDVPIAQLKLGCAVGIVPVCR